MSAPLPGQGGENPPEEKMDKSLQKENKRLKGDIKQMEIKIKAMQVELNKSFTMKDRLEALCRELQKQNKYIKAESSSKIQEANSRGKELAAEVQNNMGFMKSINENLAAISSESLIVKRENEELAKKIAILKGHYEEREQILQSALKETNDSLQKAKIDLGETKLKSAQEKEQLIGEMQKLADALLQSREHMKEAKETEISLRQMVQSYEEKFNGLQRALKDTNGSYEEFRREMNKVTSRTKELELETVKWQNRWEESNTALMRMRQNYTRLQDDLGKSHESLEKMKSLCRMLHTENRGLQGELTKENGSGDTSSTSPLSEAVAATLAGITETTPQQKDSSNCPINTATLTTSPPDVKLESEDKIETKTEQLLIDSSKNETSAEKASSERIEQEKPQETPIVSVKAKAPLACAEVEQLISSNTPSVSPGPDKISAEIPVSKAINSEIPVSTPGKQEPLDDPKTDGEGQKGKKKNKKKGKK